MFINIHKNVLEQFINKSTKTFSTASLKTKLNDFYKAKSWQIHSYGDLKDVQLTTTRIPIIRAPNELLINVEAASVNPIDLLMIGGYGQTILQFQRKFQMELPLILGRDFSGTVAQKGHNVGESFQIGDKVYGFIPIHKQGTFSEFILAEKEYICHRPLKLTASEAASLVYTSLTAWSALFITGNLLFSQRNNLRALVLGASGGVGTAAVQLLKSQGVHVFATCSADAIPLIESLGATGVFDYRIDDYWEKLATSGYYHIILDCAKIGVDNIPSYIKFSSYIGLNSPLLFNTDKYGLFGGLILSVNNLIQSNIKSMGKAVKWGFFVPSESGFKFIDKLIQGDYIKPVIHKEFNFEELPMALEEVRNGHLRGKVVIKI